MKNAKNILVGIGILAVIFTVIILVIGIKVVSTVFVYVTGVLLLLVVIGLLIYYGSKLFGQRQDD